jgi:CDP-diacylglycerol--serine O-phosphatidyltransferase
MRLRRVLIPSIFTILNMFSGFLAILQVYHGRYITAVMLIIAAMIFDSLDGFAARGLHQQSEFGIEFDSLADIVSFCVVPSLLVNALFVAELGFIGGVISFFPLLFGGVRLARFNLTATSEKKAYFIGLPVPAMAATVGSYIWFNQCLFGSYGDPKIALPLVIILSFMMVSNIRFNSKFRITFHSGRLEMIKSILLITFTILIIIFRGYVIFPIMGIFIITNLLAWIVGYEEPRVHFLLRRRGR